MLDIIRFKDTWDPEGNCAILVRETGVPEMVPGYPVQFNVFSDPT
jgi:hypothetical protein